MTDFKSLLENYKIIFFDAYGVIKNYKGLIPGIEKTFDWLNEQQKSYYVITNDASRSPELLADSYHKRVNAISLPIRSFPPACWLKNSWI